MSHPVHDEEFLRQEILAAFRAALAAVDPENAVAAHIERRGHVIAIAGTKMTVGGVVRLAGIGKAACAMIRGASRVLGDLVGEAVAVTDHAEAVPDPVELIIGEHPFPGEGSVRGGERLLQLVANSGTDDVVVVLVSGGGSSLAEAPAEGLGLDDIFAVSRDLMATGAPIEELNLVRRHLSRIKNGGLLEAASQARVATLLVSDVADGPAHLIASGPTLADGTSADDALGIVSSRLGSAAPRHVLDVLTRPTGKHPPRVDHDWAVIADGDRAARAADRHLADTGITSHVVSTSLRGEARTEARRCVEAADRGVSILAGETVVSGAVTGLGGRNQEAALAAAIAIDGDRGHIFAALGTDGIDGPTRAAGAIVDSATVARGRDQGLDASHHLDSHQSNPFLDATGDLVETGPTGTNVGDLWFIASP